MTSTTGSCVRGMLVFCRLTGVTVSTVVINGIGNSAKIAVVVPAVIPRSAVTIVAGAPVGHAQKGRSVARAAAVSRPV